MKFVTTNRISGQVIKWNEAVQGALSGDTYNPTLRYTQTNLPMMRMEAKTFTDMQKLGMIETLTPELQFNIEP